MNTFTKSILVMAAFAVLTLSILLLSGNFTGHMDYRWNMAADALRDTKWIIKPMLAFTATGLILWWLVHRYKKTNNH